jgi:hypothetical protein
LHEDADGHETELRGGAGAGLLYLPGVYVAKLPPPTSMQNDVEAHDTRERNGEAFWMTVGARHAPRW